MPYDKTVMNLFIWDPKNIKTLLFWENWTPFSCVFWGILVGLYLGLYGLQYFFFPKITGALLVRKSCSSWTSFMHTENLLSNSGRVHIPVPLQKWTRYGLKRVQVLCYLRSPGSFTHVCPRLPAFTKCTPHPCKYVWGYPFILKD